MSASQASKKTRNKLLSKKNNTLKRHGETLSPSRIKTGCSTYAHVIKKQCVNPVWNKGKENIVKSDSTDDDVLDAETIVIKTEDQSEGDLTPFKIKPVLFNIDDSKKSSKKRIVSISVQKKSPLPDQAKVTSLNDCSIAKSSRTNRSPITCPRKEDSPDRIVLDIPVLGLSTYKTRGKGLMSQAVRASLKHGYRLYDTGAHYGNERELGDAFKQYLPEQSLQRDDINIISKLDPGCVTYEDAMESAERTLRNLQIDYVDVMLVYWPNSHDFKGIEPGKAMLECYRALEDLHSADKVKHIGVYRFSTDQLQYLLRRCRVIPAMLQAEFHPYLYRKRLVQICKTNSIRMQAFCFIKCVRDPVLIELSHKYRKAPTQIILRWIIQHGVGVLPKSKTPSHIAENANIFDFSLSPSDVDRINSLNKDKSFTPNLNYTPNPR